jgi:hypothetical protein
MSAVFPAVGHDPGLFVLRLFVADRHLWYSQLQTRERASLSCRYRATHLFRSNSYEIPLRKK